MILAVGAVWHCDYERYAHAPVVRKVGISEEAIVALMNRKDTNDLTEKEQLARDLARQITAEHKAVIAKHPESVENVLKYLW